MIENLRGNLRDRVRGALLGTAVGDALGMPVEGFSHQNIRTYYRGIKAYRDDEKRQDLRAGQWTDDTQMTFALARALAAFENLEEVANHLVDTYLALRPHARRWGSTTHAAVDRLASGVHWRLSGVDEHPTNGAAMRAAPLGVWWYLTGPSRDAAAAFILDLLGITHRHPEALVAGYGQAAAVRMSLTETPETLKPVRFLQNLLEEVYWVETLLDDQERACSRRLEMLATRMREFPLDLRDACEGVTVRASSSWPFALIMFLRNPQLIEATLLSAINVGGDTDTVGAMVGSLLGSLHGWKAFPAPWKEGLEAGDRLLQEADALYKALRTRR